VLQRLPDVIDLDRILLNETKVLLLVPMLMPVMSVETGVKVLDDPGLNEAGNEDLGAVNPTSLLSALDPRSVVIRGANPRPARRNDRFRSH
jgi:hypothetical protein